MVNTVYIQLGSNLGTREDFLRQATDWIATEIGKIQVQSKIYESSPWRTENQRNYLNQVLCVASSLEVEEILKRVLLIEEKMGRVRKEKWGERIIDIDILFFNDLVIEIEGLCIPHIHLHERMFVLKPLAEIAPNFVHPKYHQTISELLIACNDNERAEEYAT